MKTSMSGSLAMLFVLSALAAGCSSETNADERVSESNSALLNADQFLYFNSNATGWSVGEANRLRSTADPGSFTLSYQVTQPWLVSSPDQASFKLTNQLDGYGTSQTTYTDRTPSVPLAVPGADVLVASSANLAVRYPALGTYVLTVDWQHQTFTIATPNTGIIGDCGIAPRGSDGTAVDYVLVYESSSTRWCVDRDFWSQPGNASAIQRFYAYGDTVYAKLQSLFHITPGEKFTYQVTDITGGAHTGSDFGLGDTTTGDAFGNLGSDPVTGAPLPGFWGYLLTLHEGINDFTGLVTPGWPSDWWADHRSPFPNSLDAVIMKDIGTAQNDANLLAAATAQHERFGVSTLSGYDPEVGMFDSLYAQYGGYAAFTSGFALIEADGLNWDTVDNGVKPGPVLTAYTIAYLQLGIHTTVDLTQSLFIASGVGSLDTGIGPYTVDPAAVRAVGNAHCSIRAAAGAGKNVTTQLAALRVGNYAGALAAGGTQAACPAECAWSTSTARCGVRW